MLRAACRSAAVFVAAAASFLPAALNANASTGDAGVGLYCNHGGYEQMVRKDNSSFANAGACVSYIVQTGNVCSAVPNSMPACTYMIRSRTKPNG